MGGGSGKSGDNSDSNLGDMVGDGLSPEDFSQTTYMKGKVAALLETLDDREKRVSLRAVYPPVVLWIFSTGTFVWFLFGVFSLSLSLFFFPFFCFLVLLLIFSSFFSCYRPSVQ